MASRFLFKARGSQGKNQWGCACLCNSQKDPIIKSDKVSDQAIQGNTVQVGVQFAHTFKGSNTGNAVSAPVNPDFNIKVVQGIKVDRGPLPFLFYQESAVLPYILFLLINRR